METTREKVKERETAREKLREVQMETAREKVNEREGGERQHERNRGRHLERKRE